MCVCVCVQKLRYVGRTSSPHLFPALYKQWHIPRLSLTSPHPADFSPHHRSAQASGTRISPLPCPSHLPQTTSRAKSQKTCPRCSRASSKQLARCSLRQRSPQVGLSVPHRAVTSSGHPCKRRRRRHGQQTAATGLFAPALRL